MSEPYSPNYLDSLGIEYIKEDESRDFGNIYKNDFNDIAKRRQSLEKKQAMLKILEYQIRKRELENKPKTRKRLFA